MRAPPFFSNNDDVAQIQKLELTVLQRLQQAIHDHLHLLRKHTTIRNIKLYQIRIQNELLAQLNSNRIPIEVHALQFEPLQSAALFENGH